MFLHEYSLFMKKHGDLEAGLRVREALPNYMDSLVPWLLSLEPKAEVHLFFMRDHDKMGLLDFFGVFSPSLFI